MFAAFAFAFIDYLQDRPPWLRTRLHPLTAFASRLPRAASRFFMAEFIPSDHATLDLVIGWKRDAISIAMGFAAPRVSGSRKAPRSPRTA